MLIVADTAEVERICATQSVSVVEERIRLGAVVVDREFWLPTNEAVRGNAETVPPITSEGIGDVHRYLKATHLQDQMPVSSRQR